jgi:hypothetical protein
VGQITGLGHGYCLNSHAVDIPERSGKLKKTNGEHHRCHQHFHNGKTG